MIASIPWRGSIPDTVGAFPAAADQQAAAFARFARVVRSTDSWIAIVYLYGHGGSGVTLSWGCTAEVANLVAMASRLAGTTFPSGPLTP